MCGKKRRGLRSEIDMILSVRHSLLNGWLVSDALIKVLV